MKNKISIITADLNNKEHSLSFERLIDEYSRGRTGDSKPLSAEIRKKLVPDLRKYGSARAYFAVYNGAIAGLTVCFIGYSTFRAAKLINIHDLIVTEKFRRTGVASALLKHIARVAKSENCCKLTLEVRADNKAALSLYKKQGFSLGAHPIYFMTRIMR